MREYNRHDAAPDNGPVVMKWLIGINVAVFLIQFMTRGNIAEKINELFAYRAIDVIANGYIWQLISYQFIHANTGHLILNMIGLWVFGGAVEYHFGHVRFLIYYLVCGIAAALFSSMLGSLGVFHLSGGLWADVSMVGASGSIYGVIAASAVLFPHARIMLLFPPVELSVRHFAIGILGIALLVIIFNWNNAGGEAGHMGGMIMGFIIMWTGHWVRKMKSQGYS